MSKIMFFPYCIINAIACFTQTVYDDVLSGRFFKKYMLLSPIIMLGFLN